jgi:hypothetical protein
MAATGRQEKNVGAWPAVDLNFGLSCGGDRQIHAASTPETSPMISLGASMYKALIIHGQARTAITLTEN